MIKAIILDVDGVIVGDKPGINFPLPHTEIIRAFRQVHSKGIPIILCTAKFGFSIQEIIKQAGLNNPHITDGGALIFDPIDNKIVGQHIIDQGVVQEFVTACLKDEILVEAYTSDTYFIQHSQARQFSDFLARRKAVIQKEPTLVESLTEAVSALDIIKMIAFTKEQSRVEPITGLLKGRLNSLWTTHPYLLPMHISIITAPGVSKAHAAQEVAENLGFGMEEILGVGDTAGDWKFMEHCGYVATLANGDDRIKELVRAKGEGKYFIAPHVNDNGVLDILKNFSLL